MDFNNREIAMLVWYAGFVGVLALMPRLRHSFGRVLRALFNRMILIALGVTSLWIAASVGLLAAVGLWHWDNLKTTLVWVVVFAFVTVFDINRISEDNTFFAKTARDALSATAVVGFIADFYSFSLWIELVLVPLLTFIGLLLAVAKTKPQFAPVEKLASAALAVVGLSYIIYGIVQMIQRFQAFATMETLREFANPILLSLLFLPFIYALSVYVAYERSFLRLNWMMDDAKLRSYAKRSAFFGFGFNLDLLRRWSRDVVQFRPADRAQVRQSIQDIKTRKKKEQAPPIVAPRDGWSPYVAKDFLAVEGLATADYHPSYDGEWFASSNMVEIGDGIFPDNLAYYVDGDEQAARRLKLMLNVNNPADPQVSEQRFLSAALTLLTAALGQAPSGALIAGVTARKAIDVEEAERRVTLARDDFTGSIQGGYSRRLTIDSSPDYRAPLKDADA